MLCFCWCVQKVFTNPLLVGGGVRALLEVCAVDGDHVAAAAVATCFNLAVKVADADGAVNQDCVCEKHRGACGLCRLEAHDRLAGFVCVACWAQRDAGDCAAEREKVVQSLCCDAWAQVLNKHCCLARACWSCRCWFSSSGDGVCFLSHHDECLLATVVRGLCRQSFVRVFARNLCGAGFPLFALGASFLLFFTFERQTGRAPESTTEAGTVAESVALN